MTFPVTEDGMSWVVLRYDDTPPSSNTNTGVGGRGNPQAIARTKRTWEGIFGMLLVAAKVPYGLTLVRASPILQFRDRRNRDMDNFYFPVAKPLGDALVKGGWLLDDNAAHYQVERVLLDENRLQHRNPMVKGRLSITLEFR